MMNLPVSRLINVQVVLSPEAAQGRNFGDLLIAGDSNVINGLQRIRDYADISGVAQDFSVSDPEFKAAELYFAQSPKPSFLSIGRWLRTATSALLEGAILSANQSALDLFTQITSGGFDVTINGTAHLITGLDFSALSNLNAVASSITSALSGAGVVTWNGQQFILASQTAGAGVAANGTITFSANPAPSDSITVNGIAITFVASSPSGNQVLIGATDSDTATNLNTFLNASVSSNIALADYAVNGLVITATYGAVGVAGNSFTLSKSSAALSLSASTLLGGVNPSSVSYATPPASGQDISSLMGWTAALALPLVPGYNAETPLQAVVALDAASTEWYGLMFAASVMPSDDDNLSIATFIEADAITRMFGVTIQNTNVLSSEVTNDLASLLMLEGFLQTFTQYSSTEPYVVASMFGRAFSVNFEGQNTTITLMYKQEPGVLPEALTTDEANALQHKRCNVFAQYNNSTSIIQYGTMAGPAYIDEIHGVDWLQNAIQTAEYNVNYTSTTKVPQTDPGTNQFVNAASGVCQQGIANGLGAPGTWNAAGFGQLQQGQYLKTGYYIFAPSVSTQSQADRAARKSVPIQIAFKLAGAIQEVDVILNVNP